MRPDFQARPRQPLPEALALVNNEAGSLSVTTDSPAVRPTGGEAVQSLRGGQAMSSHEREDADPSLPIGRRSAPRLRLSLPARLIAVEKVHTCILLNLSRTGAQVAILDAMREGEGAILRCGVIDRFAIVTRSEFGLNALSFEEPLTDAIVLEVRRYYENFEEREKRALLETARKWVTGDSGDERPL